MSRAIDADALERKISVSHSMTDDYGIQTGYAICMRLIEDAHTIEPRKKGKWIPVTNGRGGFECDQCHNYAPSYQDGVEWLSGFCPNCGAEMTEGEG